MAKRKAAPTLEEPLGCIPPEFGRRKHRVTHDTARSMRLRFFKKYPGAKAPLQVGSYHRSIFDQILAQDKCVGIRFYPGLDEQGRMTLLFCGVNGETGNDILKGVIGDIPVRCPPMCGGSNGILQF